METPGAPKAADKITVTNGKSAIKSSVPASLLEFYKQLADPALVPSLHRKLFTGGYWRIPVTGITA